MTPRVEQIAAALAAANNPARFDEKIKLLTPEEKIMLDEILELGWNVEND